MLVDTDKMLHTSSVALESSAAFPSAHPQAVVCGQQSFHILFRLRSMLGAPNSRKIRHPLGGSRRANSSSKAVNDTATEKGDNATSKLQSCINLLSSADIDQNRVGMQRLMLLTKLRPMTSTSTNRSAEQASHAIIFGGEDKSIEDLLRNVFVPFLCDVQHPIDSDDDNSCVSQDESVDSDEDDEGPRGKSWGVLHTLALRVVVNALEQRIGVVSSTAESADFAAIDFSDKAWKNIVRTLVHNIEMCHRAEIAGYSLKCLRLLHTLEPVAVTPLLRQTLLPYLVHLQDYGKLQRFPMIESEALRLLKRAELG